MALGNTLTITLDGSGGTAKVLNLIDDGNYSSEYFLPGTTSNFRAKVRHSKESAKAGAIQYIRHNVEFTEEVFADGATPAFIRQAYFVIRHKEGDVEASVTDLGEALSFFMTDTTLTKLFGWES
ncbi:TPA_asm: coat protein [ssRNA phage Gephyllon.1_27]|jgi:hypothetical protein|uniref:Coat protein n=2 Tax=Leviviricetes TaxID=2842243 RepID=A0A8S5L008_9VIRU|nr:coat protein [ssRNA phage Gephyllon.1_27]QDH89308.1 MAG: hypothetical protein H1BulkLitter6453_000002 [Leviviridae sp.]DAD51286.1 TPA_asm: coat protein [ssRNA phage Gephyllon.1_27]